MKKRCRYCEWNVKPLFVPKGIAYRDDEEKLRLEVRNGIIQAEFVIYEASRWEPETTLTPDHLSEIHRLAVNQIYRCAGHLRDGAVTISGVDHQPPGSDAIPGLVDAMCQFVAEQFGKSSPIFLASYLMWRMNWIHPFYGGNGRTARAVSYLILCAKLGFVLPGKPTIPDLIVENRQPYYEALYAADAAWKSGTIDLSMMEELMGSLLARQLVQIHAKATGKSGQIAGEGKEKNENSRPAEA